MQDKLLKAMLDVFFERDDNWITKFNDSIISYEIDGQKGTLYRMPPVEGMWNFCVEYNDFKSYHQFDREGVMEFYEAIVNNWIDGLEVEMH